MIHALLSKYRPRYVRSLTYMLQQSEYNPLEYLAWYHRTKDFSRVERRGHLVRTAKARAVQTIATILYLYCLGQSYVLSITIHAPFGIVLAIVGVLVTPYLVAYLVLLPLYILKYLIQMPIEYRFSFYTKRKLRASKATRIAVAGSYGKTSMREILRTVIAAGKSVAAPPASYNTPIGISQFVVGLTGHEEVIIFELGEYYPGDVRRLASLTMPNIGVITGINEAHLVKFKSLDRTTATIFELADYIGAGPVYVNADDSRVAAAARTGEIKYSRSGVGEWKVENAKTGLTGTSFDLVRAKTVIHAKSHLLGLHQIGPLAAAAAIASDLGLTPAEVEEGVRDVVAFSHRLEPRTDASGVVTIDDTYNGNPDGVAAGIAFLAGLSGHRRIYVTPGLVEMGERNTAVHEEIGRTLGEASIECVFLIKTSATPHIARGLEAAHFKGQLRWFDDMPALLAALPHLTLPKDVVMLQNDWPDQYA